MAFGVPQGIIRKRFNNINEKTLRETQKIIQRIDRTGDFNPDNANTLTKMLEKFALNYDENLIGKAIVGTIKVVSREFFASDGSGKISMVSKFKSEASPVYSAGTGSVAAENIKIRNHRYILMINSKPQGKFQLVSKGYKSDSRLLFDTKLDCLEPEQRLSLISESGFSQGIIDIFDHDSFLTIEDLYFLTGVQEHVKNFIVKRASEGKAGFAGKSSIQKRLNAQRLAYESKSRLYSKIKCLKTVLEINSDVNCYLSYVQVHLCTHKKFIKCDNKEGAFQTDELVERILKDISEEESRSIKRGKLLEVKKNSEKTINFKQTLIVEPGTNVLNSEIIRDNVDVLKTFKFQLKPSERGIIEITHNFPRGIDLFDLSRCEINNACACTFFIIEAIGDSSARITSKENRKIKYSGHSPLQLRYEMSREIFYISKEDERDRAEVIIDEGKNRNFIDGIAGELFYPNRSTLLSVDMKDLDINNNNEKGKFVLDIDTRTSLGYSMLEKAQDALGNPSADMEDAMRFEDMQKISRSEEFEVEYEDRFEEILIKEKETIDAESGE